MIDPGQGGPSGSGPLLSWSISLAMRAQGDGAAKIPKRLRCQFREPGNDGEGDRAEAHGEMRALADLIQQPRGEDADEEHDPEDQLHGGEPSTEQPAAADAERDARRGAEAEDERAFSIGQGKQEPGDAADEPCAGLAAHDADDDWSADAEEGERAAAKIEMQNLSDGVGSPHETGAGLLRALGQIGWPDVTTFMRSGKNRRIAAAPLPKTPEPCSRARPIF